MRLPEMKYSDRITKSQQIKFGGLDHCVGAADGALWDMRNLTGDHSPVLAARSPRLKYRTVADPGGIFFHEGLCWVSGSGFYYEGAEKGKVEPGEKVFAAIGSYIVIFPDKCFYNVVTGEFGSLEAKWSGGNLTFCDGMLYGEEAAANTIRCEGVDWSEYFRVGDAVMISGCTVNPANNKSNIIREIDGDKLYFYENGFALGEDGTQYTESGELTVSRIVPDLKFVCENKNRLWGCTEDTIYACKLGDIFNWNVYDGLDTDAYAVDPGSAGAFTGCVSFQGYPTFFQEDHIYKVYGSVPSNFQVMGSSTLGLAAGSYRSLAVAGETLFYLGRSGVVAYNGGVPQSVGSAFGLRRFKNAAGGADGLKYYISMEDEKGQWGVYVFDTQLNLWHQEDESHVRCFASCSGDLCILNAQGELWFNGNAQHPPEGVTPEDSVEWYAEFGDFVEQSPNKKGVGKLQLRLEPDVDAKVQVWLMFDSDGRWQKVSEILSEGVKRSYYLPVVPRRADHYRLKITGTGGCRIYSLVREYYSGSELRSTRGRN